MNDIFSRMFCRKRNGRFPAEPIRGITGNKHFITIQVNVTVALKRPVQRIAGSDNHTAVLQDKHVIRRWYIGQKGIRSALCIKHAEPVTFLFAAAKHHRNRAVIACPA